MSKCVIVGEIGINHNGDLNVARDLTFVFSSAGGDYVKFQKREINLVYTDEELDRFRESPWGMTNREQKNGLEFGKSEYDQICKVCETHKIAWFASPWDINSVYFLSKYDLPYIKVASALITDFELLEAVKQTTVPVIISTGMSSKKEVDECLKFLGDQVEYILACTSTYPTPREEINLNFIKTLKTEYPDKRIGFSSHHQGVLFPSSAVLLGAEMVEFHITMDRSMYGSDQSASIEPIGVHKIINYIRSLEIGLGDGKWTVFPGEVPIREKLRK